MPTVTAVIAQNPPASAPPKAVPASLIPKMPATAPMPGKLRAKSA